jgi:hypothetical protein
MDPKIKLTIFKVFKQKIVRVVVDKNVLKVEPGVLILILTGYG